jgi:hypothetical protein
MAFMGLTGPALARARIALIIVPAFLLFGFNQSNLGGVLSYPSFIKYYPIINTVDTKGSVKAHNANIQGEISSVVLKGTRARARGKHYN